MPNLITLIMPSRFTIFALCYRLAFDSKLTFCICKKFGIMNKVTNNFAQILIFLIVLLYSTSHYKVLIKLQNLLIKNISMQTVSLDDKNFWNEIKNVKPEGYIITSFSSSSISMRKS